MKLKCKKKLCFIRKKNNSQPYEVVCLSCLPYLHKIKILVLTQINYIILFCMTKFCSDEVIIGINNILRSSEQNVIYILNRRMHYR